MTDRLKAVASSGQKWLSFALSRPERVLFDHLPKCAGTTIIDYLSHQYPRRLSFNIDGRNPGASINRFEDFPPKRQRSFYLVTGHNAFEIAGKVHPKMFKFTVLRDPIDRIISHYYFVLQETDHYLHERVVTNDIQLEDYSNSGLSSELRNWYTTHFTGLSLEEAESDPEASVRKAKSAVLKTFDLVGFQDDLATLVEKLRISIGLKKVFLNQKANQTKTRKSLKQVSQAVRESIAKANHLDVQLYEQLRQGTQCPNLG